MNRKLAASALVGILRFGGKSRALAFASSASNDNNPQMAQQEPTTSSSSDDGTPPLLPPPSNNPGESVPVLKLGETIRFEEMGPVILNTDGTMRRIDNWDSMTEQEQKATWRIISKRNEQRRKKLLEEQAKVEASGDEEQKSEL